MTLLLVCKAVLADGISPRAARYEVKVPSDPHPKQVAALEIAVAPSSENADCNWYRLKGTKVNGDSFAIWFLAGGNPFVVPRQAVRFDRYILQEPGQAAIEYIDQQTQRALLPLFNFQNELLPRTQDQGFPFSEGTYLGHAIRLKQDGPLPHINPPAQVTRLVFRTDLIIGTGRNFRDDGKGRKRAQDDYQYVPFTQADYDTMIAAGINYFREDGTTQTSAHEQSL